MRSDLNGSAAEQHQVPRRLTRLQARLLLPLEDIRVLSNEVGPYAVQMDFLTPTPAVYERTRLAALM